MGLEAEKPSDAPARLIAAGRALLAQGDAGFSLSRLCAQAGVTLVDFRASFASKAELMQQLMEPQKQEPPPQADPWLERRLRVFERALGTLEEKADKRERETRQTIARLEERLSELSGTQLKLDVAAAAQTVRREEAMPAPVVEVAGEVVAEPQTESVSEEAPNPLLLAPLEPAPLPRLDTDVLDNARRAALAHGRALERARARRERVPTRALITGTLAVLLLLACAALTLVRANNATPQSGGGMAQRVVPVSPLAQLTLRGDSGDVGAQRALALAYLKGDGVAKDIQTAQLWAQAAASGGDAEAQYLLGTLNNGDPAQAFSWLSRAAAAGHLKAMHALAVAYAQGQGTARNEAAAADWFAKAAVRGFVDSAFNLAVLYERGHGVAQNPKEALRWYRAAAKAGDRFAAARARTLAQQVGI
jgi:AcrR family transcriptional regulator